MLTITLPLLFTLLSTPSVVEKPIFDFAVIGDTQGGGNSRTGWNRWVFRRAIKKMNKNKRLRWLSHLGDQMTWGPYLNRHNRLFKYYYYKKFYKRIKPPKETKAPSLKIPFYLTIGNHEILLRCKGCKYWENRKYKRFWRNYWRKTTGQDIYKRTYYSFSYKGYTFISIDTSHSLISDEQVVWFRKVMSSPETKKVFIFSHRPFPVLGRLYKKRIRYYNKYTYKYLRKAFQQDFYPSQHFYTYNILFFFGSHTYGRMNPAVYTKCLRKSCRYVNGLVKKRCRCIGYYRNGKYMYNILMKHKNKVLAIFHGHYHAYRKYYINGVLAYCSGGGGGSLQTKYDFHHYLVVSVYNNSFSVRAIPLIRHK